MEVIFRIQYGTNWGEDVCILFSDGQFLPLHTQDGKKWSGTLTLAPTPNPLSYRYVIRKGEQYIRKEWDGVKRNLRLNRGYSRIILDDAWRERPEDSCLYSSAFSGKEKPEYNQGAGVLYSQAILIKVRCPRLPQPDWKLAINGNQPSLGNWEKPMVMRQCGPNEWYVLLDASRIQAPFEYKFQAWNTALSQGDVWITGENRRIESLSLLQGDLYVLQDDTAHFDLPQWKAAGVAIPVFSLRSESSWGVGDFGDLKKFVDWAVLTKQKVIQILPINDTTITHTWTDSYPYNSISIFAFHPMYIDISALYPLKDKKKMQAYETERKKLNRLPKIDYEATGQLKQKYLHELFDQEKKRILGLKEYQNFCQANEEWLLPYAAFSYLRDLNGTPVFTKEKEYASYSKEKINQLYQSEEKAKDAIDYYCCLQFILHVQLLAASDYARKKGVLLKGDIPIGISPNSVEAWTEPHYFNLNSQAGAPPDPFSAKGQNWGFPTYNWEEMAKDNYKWWKHRMRKMSEYFDAYRIDHILGFFRIWEIPSHSVEGLLGQFVPSLGLSVEEIEQYGLHFRKDTFTKPYISQSIVSDLFGELAESVKQTYLCKITPHEFCLLPAFNTQRKIEAYFDGKNDPESIRIKEGLFALVNNVLFVVDHQNDSLFHPRIAVQDSPAFHSLRASEQKAIQALYEDYYYHRQDDFWRSEALKKLPELIDSTRMLACGEDLGMIPGCVKGVMDELRILSLEIERMPKQYGETFANPERYPYLSVCSISTHDMSTLRGWWHEDPNLTQRYYEQVLRGWGKCPKEAPGWICDTIVVNHLLSNSMLCILSFQDWLSIDENVRYPDADAERINVPADSHHYWRYRMHLTIEELMKCDFLNRRIANMVQKSGRSSY